MFSWIGPVPGGKLSLVFLLFFCASLALPGCLIPTRLSSTDGNPASPDAQGQIQVKVTADGSDKLVDLPAGSTVQNALSAAGITVKELDRIDPPLFTVLQPGSQVRVIRVREEFDVQTGVIPFEHQVLKNESMPEGESRLVQPGVNGLQEVTYRRLFEDGEEVSNSPVKTVVVKEAVPEIVMVGSQAPFASFQIPGRLAYLLAGNAWIIEGTTGNRRPVVTSGDLDGRIFSLSPDGVWLLFTRRSDKEGTINSLWAVKISGDGFGQLIDLKIANVVRYAGWKPGSYYLIGYSTVEPRASAPGWQANNDLNIVSLSISGQVKLLEPLLETNMGGNYGWWGMAFAWSPDGSQMAYTRPDGVGLFSANEGELSSLLDLVPLQTGGNWAWVPGLKWGPDGKTLYTVDHVASPGSASPEASQVFDLTAVPLTGGPPVHLVSQAGMFAYPLPSPVQPAPGDENAYQVAYLQAIFPDQSESSRYHLVVMDRDGSNRRPLFPAEGAPGLDPQDEWGAWSPAALQDSGHFSLAVIYQKNLWLVDSETGEARQITGDGLASRIDWK